jgi:hypothetical protein
MKVLKFILLILFFANTYSQNSELILLKGKVVVKIKEIKDINILNLRSQSSTITDENENFSVFVKVGDTLRFLSIQIVTRDVIIQDKDVSKQLFVVVLEPKINELEEVEIGKYNNINAVSLGILEKPAKHYTPAERRLKTASSFDPTANIDMMAGGSISFDPILNAISGRTAMLKKELEIERKERLLQKIENMFSMDYFTSNLKIPSDYVRGFCYYAIDDEKLVSALQSKNKTLSMFEFSRISVDYLSIQKFKKI